jgi:hypothetical protein
MWNPADPDATLMCICFNGINFFVGDAIANLDAPLRNPSCRDRCAIGAMQAATGAKQGPSALDHGRID